MEKLPTPTEKKKDIITYTHLNDLCAAAAIANREQGEFIPMYETPTSIQFDHGEQVHMFPKPAYYFSK